VIEEMEAAQKTRTPEKIWSSHWMLLAMANRERTDKLSTTLLLAAQNDIADLLLYAVHLCVCVCVCVRAYIT